MNFRMSDDIAERIAAIRSQVTGPTFRTWPADSVRISDSAVLLDKENIVFLLAQLDAAQQEAATILANATRVLTKSCATHGHVGSWTEFLLIGGDDCPICWRERAEKAEPTIVDLLTRLDSAEAGGDMLKTAGEEYQRIELAETEAALFDSRQFAARLLAVLRSCPVDEFYTDDVGGPGCCVCDAYFPIHEPGCVVGTWLDERKALTAQNERLVESAKNERGAT